MTDLDRRVVELGGKPPAIVNDLYAPSTNLLHAFALWNEARPEGWYPVIYQTDADQWCVARVPRETRKYRPHLEVHTFTDLPRAITQAWIEAKEAPCQQ
jgi:hypothetical protein